MKWVIGIIVLVAIAAGAVFLSSSNNQTPKVNTTLAPSPSSTNSTQPQVQTSANKYLTYTSNTLETIKNKRRVLFFYASWCPTCRPADADISQNENKLPNDLVVIRINYNDPNTDAEEKTLAQKYGITYQHTFVQIDANGNQVTKWNGGQLEELLTNIK